MARAQGRRSKLYLQRRQLRLVLRGNSRIRETSGRGSRRTASPANGERKERRPGALRREGPLFSAAWKEPSPACTKVAFSPGCAPLQVPANSLRKVANSCLPSSKYRWLDGE